MMPVGDAFEAVLSRLSKVRRRDDSHAMACCPAHEDRTPSLSVSRGTKQPVVFMCSLIFSSKVCQLTNSVDLKELLMENAKTCYARFVIVDDYVRVEGATFLETVNESGLKEIIDEVAKLADAWELKLTG